MKVRITLAALTRVEYTKVLEVPDDTDLDALVDQKYDEIDGSEYYDDPDFWERGNCYAEIIKDDD